MKKRVPRNPKYRHVKSKLDTGCSLIKYMEKMEELKKNYRYRKGELFKRLKVSTFAQLVIQVASVSDMNDVLIDEETSGLDGKLSPLSDEDVEQTNGTLRVSPEPFIDDESDSEAAVSPRSTLQSLVSGVGELDMESHGQRKSSQGPVSSPGPINQPYPDCPYLLLDVRDREDYAQCHLISGKGRCQRAW
ncbi:hypothetical protein MATL_G00244620 [Megalops atlanticus]|uniref:Centrosomal protein of 41 kDa n=1 Tax=Megalops atlanticus TaxID=7932 RepID=A0A9D3PAM3_MEGAT|nr:hypothetical protein MATL_G00244620 [Megalops atlanticus]